MSGEIEATARGHLAADAEVRLANGKEVCALRIAVGVRRRTDSGEWEDVRTDWIDVTVWGSQVGACSTLKKGDLVDVRGKLRPGAYLSKQTGEAVASLAIDTFGVAVVPRLPRAASAAA